MSVLAAILRSRLGRSKRNRVKRPAPTSPAPAPAPAAQSPLPASPPPSGLSVEDRASKIMARLAEAKLPEIAPGLIQAGASDDAVEEAIHNARMIKHIVTRAREYFPEGTLSADAEMAFILAGASAAHVGRELHRMLVEFQSPEIRNSHLPGARPAGAATNHGWDKAIARSTAAREGATSR